MNCQKVQSLISAYLDGELNGQDMLAIRYHLSDCPECSGEYESLLAIKRTFGKLLPRRPADDLASRICSRLVDVRVPFHVRVSAAVRSYFRAFPSTVRVSAAGIAVIAGLLMIRGGDVAVPSRLAGIPISSATLKTFAEDRPLYVEAAPLEVGARAASERDRSGWRPFAEDGRFPQVSKTGSLILTAYTP